MAEKDEQNWPDNTLPFRAALSNIFGDIAESVSEKKFAECQIYLRSRLTETKFSSIIHKLHETIGKDLKDTMTKEMEGMMTEESLIEGLSRLKQLVTESPYDPGQIAWRPPGNVALHLRTFDINKIDEEIIELAKLVNHLESENNFLFKTLTKKRQKTHSLDKKITKTTNIGANSITKLEKTKDQIQKHVDDLDKHQTDII